ncbi:MAG: hypothetical protein U9O87_01255, partial [Verrucomicrobiota bacterium]|nr:hypothetical protein [Verrucomicrobiota bacterium]
MNKHTLKVLEFDICLDWIADSANTPDGKKEIKGFIPDQNLNKATSDKVIIESFMNLLHREIPLDSFTSLSLKELFKKLKIKDTAFPAEELFGLLHFIDTIKRLKRMLEKKDFRDYRQIVVFEKSLR